MEGCSNIGEYRAPRQGESGYHWFCLSHVREYNKSYNYFAGMDAQAAQRFRKDAVVGHRPTWRMGQGPQLSDVDIDAHIRRLFGDPDDRRRTPCAAEALLPEQIRKALELFNLDHPAERQQIRQQYRKLVKRYHPDVSHEHQAEAMFKRMMEAYQLLMQHYER
jgi:hypothetical protein